MGFAQQGINYKALIKDDLGNVLVSQTIDVRFTVIAETGTTDVYTETHTGVSTDANGIIVLNIGEGTTSDVFTEINWSSDTHALKTEITAQDSTFEFMSTTQFMAVPYALSAANVSGLEKIKENTYSGWRLIGRNAANHGNIGNTALDFSYSDTASFTYGATGLWSLATGKNTTASGTSSTAMGSGTHASLGFATAMGKNTIASAITATSMGNTTTASGTASTAMGYATTASGSFATAIGKNTRAESRSSFAIGRYNKGGGNPIDWIGTDPLFEVGNGTFDRSSNAFTVYKNGIVAMGRNPIISTNHLLSIGDGGTFLNRKNALTLYSSGSTNLFTLTNISDVFIPNNDALVVKQNGNIEMGNYYISGDNQILTIGNGYDDFFTGSLIRSNALTVYKGTGVSLSDNSGYVMIGNNDARNLIFDKQGIMARNNGATANLHLQREGGALFIGGDIVNDSDRRLKKDIEALAYGLKEILQLQPKAYNWKNRTQDHKSLGLIAQDVQLLIKEIVTEQDDAKKILGISYTELIPVLINAIQEQQAIIDKQNLKINGLTIKLEQKEENLNSFNQRLEKAEAHITANDQ